jgi:hypothetical protein
MREQRAEFYDDCSPGTKSMRAPTPDLLGLSVSGSILRSLIVIAGVVGLLALVCD